MKLEFKKLEFSLGDWIIYSNPLCFVHLACSARESYRYALSEKPACPYCGAQLPKQLILMYMLVSEHTGGPSFHGSKANKKTIRVFA